jgi:hypothetical protein
VSLSHLAALAGAVAFARHWTPSPS